MKAVVKAQSHSRWLILGTLLGSLAGWPLLSSAEGTVQGTAPQTGQVAGVTSAAGVTGILGGAAVDARYLEASRGGADLNLYDIKSDGVVRDNQAYNLTTGNNWVTEGSFAGASGFPTVVQNSGNNVLIQNATIINLQVQ